jgi:hypothetical protein
MKGHTRETGFDQSSELPLGSGGGSFFGPLLRRLRGFLPAAAETGNTDSGTDRDADSSFEDLQERLLSYVCWPHL